MLTDGSYIHRQNLFVHIWKGKTSIVGSSKHSIIIKSMKKLVEDYAPGAAQLWDWKGSFEDFADYVTQVSAVSLSTKRIS
jgi:hypothetical protein